VVSVDEQNRSSNPTTTPWHLLERDEAIGERDGVEHDVTDLDLIPSGIMVDWLDELSGILHLDWEFSRKRPNTAFDFTTVELDDIWDAFIKLQSQEAAAKDDNAKPTQVGDHIKACLSAEPQ
jgi:hypothetical protein